jgi:hypothetical protein
MRKCVYRRIFQSSPASSVTGTVSFVEVNTILSNGTSVQATSVTLMQNGGSTSVRFCGDQSSQFLLNQVVTTNFNPGQPCATLVVVIVVG